MRYGESINVPLLGQLYFSSSQVPLFMFQWLENDATVDFRLTVV
jgi:hypothetical protein